MTQHVDSELILRRWFEDGPSAMPDRVVGAIAEGIDRVPQRRGLRRRWTSPVARRTIRWALLAAATLALVGAGLWLIGRTTQQRLPVPSSAPPSARGTDVPASRAPRVLNSADYRFVVPFTVELGGWRPGLPAGGIAPEEFGLIHTALPELAIMSIAQTRIAPKDPAIAPNTISFDDMEPWPEDISTWLADQPTTSVLSVEKSVVDARPSTSVTVGCPDAGRCTLDISTQEGPTIGLSKENPRLRLVEIRTASGQGLVITFSATAPQFDAASRSLDDLLASLTFN